MMIEIIKDILSMMFIDGSIFMCIMELIIFVQKTPFFFNDPKYLVYSNKPIEILSIQIKPRSFRLTMFLVLFVLALDLDHYKDKIDSLTSNAWITQIWDNMFYYSIFYLTIEVIIIFLNKDNLAKAKLHSCFQPSLTTKTKTIIIIIILCLAALLTQF
jgi:hypothetical protein